MSELAFRMLWHLIKVHIDRPGRYYAVWQLADLLGIEQFGAGLGADTKGQKALDELLALGLIEEVPDLHHRYRIKIGDLERTQYEVYDCLLEESHSLHWTRREAELSKLHYRAKFGRGDGGICIREIVVTK